MQRVVIGVGEEHAVGRKLRIARCARAAPRHIGFVERCEAQSRPPAVFQIKAKGREPAVGILGCIDLGPIWRGIVIRPCPRCGDGQIGGCSHLGCEGRVDRGFGQQVTIAQPDLSAMFRAVQQQILGGHTAHGDRAAIGANLGSGPTGDGDVAQHFSVDAKGAIGAVA